jgi:hypothetical protein
MLSATDNGARVQEVAATAHEWQQLGEALSATPASPVGSAEAPANVQSEGSLALQQAPAPQVERRAAKQVPATEGPSAFASLPTAPAAVTTAEARSTTTAEATAEVAAGTNKAAAQATTGGLLGSDLTLLGPTHAQVCFFE